jgi:flagellar motor switch protein FliN/FliY
MTTDDTIMNPDQEAGVATATEDQGNLDAESTALLADLGKAAGDAANLDMLLDVNLTVTVELGRSRLKFRDVLNLANGSVIELARQTSEPVDIMVNGALLATGEVVVVDDHFAVRITKLLNRVERLKRVL